MKPAKKLTRHKVNYEDVNDLESVVLAKLGFGHKYIRQQTSLTPCQVTYRLTKAKNAEGLPKGIGYSTAYRLGQSEYAEAVMRAVVPVARRETEKSLPKLFVHPTPKVIRIAA